MAQIILMLAGPDRPGLVSQVSEMVAAHGGSWMESRLAHLAGHFAGIVLASLPDDAVAKLTAAARSPGVEGLQITVHRSVAETAPASDATLVLSLICHDRPGIIRDITRVLATAHVNIDELTTNVSSGSFSGEAMFQAEARLRLPPGLAADGLRAALEQLGNELMVDIHLSGGVDNVA
jgi:glycine cleavage system regulatory protein